MYAEWMFHGKARRIGAPYPGLVYRYGDKLRHPLRLTKNVYRIRDIFNPTGNWIVSGEVKSLLHDLRNVAFLRVEFECVFEAAFELDEPPPREMTAEPVEDDDVFALFDHDDELAEKVGDWYELIVPDQRQIARELKKGLTTYSIPRELTSSALRVDMAPHLFDEYPITWEGGHFLRHDVFELLERFIDPHFFRTRRIPLQER